jgi:hypothetical protein
MLAEFPRREQICDMRMSRRSIDSRKAVHFARKCDAAMRCGGNDLVRREQFKKYRIVLISAFHCEQVTILLTRIPFLQASKA